jgi:phosphomannomutase
MSVLMRSVSGIRGIVGPDFNPALIANYVNAFVQITGAKKVVIGRDTRPTGGMVEAIAAAACQASGAEAVMLGIASTPTVEMAVLDHKAGGGIIITASHNPIEWNALKFLTHEGIFLDEAQVKQLFALVDGNSFAWQAWNGVKGLSRLDTSSDASEADRAHIDGVLKLACINPELIRSKRFKVAYDAVNGAGSLIVPRLLRELGCETFAIHVTPNGIFPHNPEPTPEGLADLSAAVKKHGCVVGFATDPDADRCAMVDENGVAIGEEYTLAFATELVLAHTPGPVTINLSTSRMCEDIAAKYGVQCEHAKVGEINVTVQMKKNGSVVGGEGNGGVILPALHYGRDGILAVAMTLQLLAERGETVSQVVKSIPAYHIEKRKYSASGAQLQAKRDALKQRFADAAFDDRDGFRFAWSKKWVHVRPSNTEPVSRIIAEAPTREEAMKLCDEVAQTVG